MKKSIITRLILLIVLTFFTSTFTYSSHATFQFNRFVDNKQETTVYITKTGKKYHISSCGYLRQSKISIGKNDAINKGFTPCSKCRP